MSCNYKTNIKDIQSKYTFKIFCAGDTSQIEQEIGNLSDLTTTAKNNLVSAINEVDGELSAKEDKSNKVTTITSSSTDTQYPSAKLLYNQLALKEDVANKTTTLSSSSTDTQYPSAKAVYDSQVAQDTIIDQTQEELDYYKTIYNVLPKVEGNGENITLDNTGESILKLDTRGQCKQESTSGYNLVDTLATNTSITGSGLTYSRAEDGEITISGTSNRAWDYVLTTYFTFKAGKTYTLSYENNDTTPVVLYINFNSNNGGQLSVNQYTHSATRTIVEDQTVAVKWSLGSGQTVHYKLKIMIEEGSTAHDYEPYTGGQPSPSPDFPQQIHEVSGDNEVVVRGKQLFDGELELGILDGDTGQPVANTSYMRTKNFILVEELTEYVINSIDISAGLAVYEYKEDFTYNLTSNKVLSNEQAFTTEAGTKYIKFRPRTANTDLTSRFMLNKGGTSATYEPYNGDTYELSLGVENLLQNTATTQTISGITFTKNEDGSVLVNGTATATINTYKIATISLEAGNYTLSGCPSGGGTSTYRLVETNAFFDDRGSGSTKEVSSTTSYSFYIQIYNGAICNNLLFKPQLVKGDKINSFTPYGQEPIKMRGIGTYEDYFVRNSGKNLYDINNEHEVIIDGNGTERYGVIVEAPNKKVSVSATFNGDIYYKYLTNGTYSNYSSFNSNSTFSVSDKIIFYAGGTSKLSDVSTKLQIEISDTPTTYEPYGTGKWCKYNAIGKEIFGNLYIRTWTSTYYGLYFYAAPNNILNGSVVLSDIYKQVSATLQTWVDYTMTIDGKNIQIKDSRYTSVSDYQEAVYNNSVYYQLETPYLSLVENETLQTQLDAIEKALGKDGQTNISQVNNDAPFKIYASALMKISGE